MVPRQPGAELPPTQADAETGPPGAKVAAACVQSPAGLPRAAWARKCCHHGGSQHSSMVAYS